MRQFLLPLSLITVISLSGCAGMTDTQQRTLSGAAIGAGGGAVVGAIAGDTGLGAVLGAGAGALGGYLYDQQKKSQEDAYARGVRDGRARRR